MAADVRGWANLEGKSGSDAAAEFQKVIDHRGIDLFSPLHPLAHLGLGRAYALKGDLAKARKSYEDFFAIWKDADPDIPIRIRPRKNTLNSPQAERGFPAQLRLKNFRLCLVRVRAEATPWRSANHSRPYRMKHRGPQPFLRR